MANFSALKTAIQNAIKQNGNEEITGDVLQQILLSIVSTMGDGAINTIEQNLSNETTTRQGADTQLQNAINAIKANIDNGYVYAGIATPSSTPVSGKVFYIATAAGTYTNFGGQVLTQGINILRYNGSAWSHQQIIGIDDVPTAGSNKFVKSGGVQNEFALGAVYDVSAKNPTGGPNNDGKWESLSALLSDANLNTLIPTAYRKGGMSIKFVHTNDNKYIRYNLIADEFTTDITKWAIAEEGVYVENPEFIYVKTDAEDKILWAIRTDGGIYYGAGVPQQVIDYINGKIAELSLDEYEDIVAFLNDLEKGDKTLQDLLDEKVDKEEGKSLIDEEYANGVHYIENPEFTEVKVDNEDRILEAIMKDGTKLLPAGVKVIGTAEYDGATIKTIDNPEFAGVWLDGEDKILFGVQTDGNFLFGCGVPNQIKEYIEQKIEELSLDEYESIVAFIGDYLNNTTLEELLSKKVDGEYVENPEFMEVELDADDKILGGRKVDGTKFENNDVELNGNATVGGSLEVDGTVIKNIEDPEGRLEIATDSENKIISYRKDDGTLVENVGIETPNVTAENISAKEVSIEGGEATLEKATLNSLELTNEGMTEFQQALRDSGFRPGGAGDWSNKDSMYIPEPRLAHLNIITNFNLVNLTKTSDVKCQVEFFDGAGNYFNKWIILNGQGRSSLQFMKKGLGADFFNEDPNSTDFDKDNVFSMKFGDWVYQDSFHIKSFYTDWPRCTTPIVYKLTDEVVRTRGVMKDRPYKKYYVGKYSDAANANTQSKLDQNMETGARCIPDGFPVIVYLNGKFWGVNSWQLKKHRDNYMLNKKKDTNIHLDGDMGSHDGSIPFWLWDGIIDWSIYCSGTYGIETRNPKNLYCVDGKKYNADTHDAEIITTAIAEAWIDAGKIIPTDKSIESIARKELADDGITDPTPEQLADAISKVEGYFTTTGKVRKHIEDLTTYIPYINGLIDGSILIDGQQANTEQIKAAIEDRFDVATFIDYIVTNNVVGNTDAWDNNGQIITWGELDGSSNLNWSVNIYDCDITFGLRFDGISATAANNSKLGSNYPLYSIFWNYYFEELKERYHELRDKGIFDADHITQLFRNWMDRVGYDNYAKEYKKWPESPCFRDGSKTYVHNPTTGGFYGSIERIYLWIKKRIQYMDAADFFNYNQQ